MDGLLILLALGILLLIVLGFCAAIWLVVKFVTGLFRATPPPLPRTPASSLQALPLAAAGRRDSQSRGPQRDEALELLKREVNIAFAKGRISKTAYLEMQRYITQEREALQPQPQFAQPPAGAVAAPAPVSGAAAPPAAQAQPVRKPEDIRAAIARLHADAQAPAQPAPSPAASLPTPSAAGAAHAPPVRPPLAPVAPKTEGHTLPPAPEPRKPLAERLFTPENVRILQSVGICIIFISAVAFVRTQVWENVSALAKMGFMLAGTAACLGIGYLLRRFTQLRITALGLLILGQLSLLLDAHAALIKPGAAALAGASLYPYSPVSLWTLCFILFTAAAVWHARTLKEPLFDAFTFFGALAAWGSGATWLGVQTWLMPAAFVPAACLAAFVSYASRRDTPVPPGKDTPVPPGKDTPVPPGKDTPVPPGKDTPVPPGKDTPVPPGKDTPVPPGKDTPVPPGKDTAAPPSIALQRWSLPWWLDAGWQIGAVLLALALPAAALLSGQARLHEHYAAHAAAIVALGVGLLVSAWRGRRGTHLHAATLLLLFTMPLAAYAFAWPLTHWSLCFALPGAVLVAVALLGATFLDGGAADHDAPPARPTLICLAAPLAAWGLACALVGFGWACWAYIAEGELAFSAWSVGAATFAALAFALLRRVPWGPWLATACAAVLTVMCCDLAGMTSAHWPVLWLSLAAVAHAAWTFIGPRDEVRTEGAFAADMLALAALGYLIHRSPLLPWTGEVAVSSSISAAWIAAALYAMLTSSWDRVVLRRLAGVALLSPAWAYGLYHAGCPFVAPAPWLALLALAVVGIASVIESRERRPELFYGALTGTGVILAHGAALAVWQWLQGQPFLAPAPAFGLLSLAAVALAARLRAYWNSDIRGLDAGAARGVLTTLETFALLLLAMVAVCVAGHRGLLVPHGPFVLAGIAALVAVVALVAEALSTLFVRAIVSAPGSANSSEAELLRRQRPFYTARAVVALLFSGLAYYELLISAPALSKALAITAPWVAALVPLLIALRGSLDISLIRRAEEPLAKRAPDALVFIAALLATLLASMAATRALHTEFWLTAALPAVRNSCALFFAVTLLVSLFGAAGLKRAFAPVTGMLALLGLAGCAYGAFDTWPDQSFGVCCALLAWLAALLLAVARKADSFRATRVPGALSFSAAGVSLLGAVFLVVGLVEWNAGAAHSWGVLGWFLLATLAWRASARTAPAWFALASGLGATAAVLHALRWAAQDFTQFGPGLATAALLMLALREVAAYVDAPPNEETDARPAAPPSPLQGRSGGIIAAAFVAAALSLVFGAWGGFVRHEWLCCITLAENALLLTALSVLLRRHACATARQHFALEMGAWFLLALAVVAGLSSGAGDFPLSASGWILVSAVFLLIGMAGESIVAALAGTPPKLETAERGVPFLGSRHCAAFIICAVALVAALFQPHAFTQGAAQLHETWRAILGAAALAIYASMAKSSAAAERTRILRGVASFLAYVVLLPGGYLCFLHAHSTGSPWGAMYLFALVPLLLVAAYVLEREKLVTQASQALLGADLVSVGALVLAFLTGKHLAIVPCATFAALAAEMLLLRAWRPLRNSGDTILSPREIGIVSPECSRYSLLACLALIGAAFFGLRALLGWQAWGDPRGLWAWEMPAMAALGLALTALGGAARIETDERGRSLVARCGACLNFLALPAAAFELAVYGSCARYLHCMTNMDRLDAVIICLLLFSAMSLAARRWLEFAAARYVAPAALLAAYAMYMWKLQPEAWEWYTVPAAAFLFVWAWQTARAASLDVLDAGPEHETTALLLLASILALGPSFIQSLSNSRDGTCHFLALLGLSVAILFGAMLARRKIPLLAGGGAMILATLIKAVEWAHHKDVLWPVMSFAVGCLILGVGVLFESRMNQAFRKAVDRAKAEARMFWVSWQ